MNEQKVTPKDFFLHLGAAVALYVSAISILNLLFRVIDYAFPDPLSSYVDPYSSAVRWAVAMLIIFFPLYLVLAWLVERDVRTQPLKKQLRVRRWLSYLTLFVAALTIAIDLVVLVQSFLGGELTARFVLKVLAVLLVAGIVFGYYIFDLRRRTDAGGTGLRWFAIGSVVVVLASFVVAFIVMGSPGHARAMRFDEERVSDLSNIQWQIVSQWQNTEKMPQSLDALSDPLSGFTVPKDPETGASYTYEVTGNLSFKLCADFSLESSTTQQVSSRAYPTLAENENWQHPAGEYCFSRTIDPSRYPPRSNTNAAAVPVPAPKSY